MVLSSWQEKKVTQKCADAGEKDFFITKIKCRETMTKSTSRVLIVTLENKLFYNPKGFMAMQGKHFLSLNEFLQ